MAESVFEEITIGNATVRLEHRDIPTKNIKLFVDNPRLRYLYRSQSNGGGLETLEEFIRAMSDTPKLRKDIEMNGGLRERVIVLPNGGDDFEAVEGNRRRVCIGDLQAQHPDDSRWQTMPARVLPRDIDPRKVALLLSDLHVAGKVKWDAHEKAGQVYHMNKVLKIPFDEILVHLHAGKATVSRWLNAYAFLIERFETVDNGKYRKKGDGKWSWFDELFRSKELKQHLENEDDFADNFCRWVGEERLVHGVDVRFLPKILANAEARRIFETRPKDKAFAEAKRIIETDDPEEGSDFFKRLAKMRDDLTSAAKVKEILRIRTDKVARQRVLETYEAMVDFMRLADVEPPKSKS